MCSKEGRRFLLENTNQSFSTFAYVALAHLAVIRFEDDIVAVRVEHLPTHSGRVPVSALFDDILRVACQIPAVWGDGVVSLHCTGVLACKVRGCGQKLTSLQSSIAAP